MKSRLSRLAENRLPLRIAGLWQQFNTLKNAQTLGSHNVRTYRVFSDATADITVSNINATLRTIKIVFTPDDTTFPNLGLVHHLEYVPTVTGYQYLSWWLERLTPVDNVQTWYLYVSGSSTLATAALKFYFYANGHGTFTVNEI